MANLYGVHQRPLPRVPPSGEPVPIVRQSVPNPEPIPSGKLEDYDILLPNGLLVTISFPTNSTLLSLKTTAFKEARSYPLFKLMKDIAHYNLVGITNQGAREEFVDEKRCLCELDLFQPILKFVEKQGSQEEKLFNAELSNLIGARVHDFEVMGPEIRDFRRGLFQVCKATVDERSEDYKENLRYHFPSVLESSDSLPLNLRQMYSTYQGGTKGDTTRNLSVSVLFVGKEDKKKIDRYEAIIDLSVDALPEDLIELALMKLKTQSRIKMEAMPHECVLKVLGREEYFIEVKPISQYRYIRQCMLRNTTPQLTVNKMDELIPKEEDRFQMPSVWEEAAPVYVSTKLHEFGPSGMEFTPTWDVVGSYSIKIVSATHVNITENHKVFVKCGLYHGGEALCDAQATRPEGEYTSGCQWNENMEFAINICDLPRSVKLCFVIYSIKDSQAKKKRKGDSVPIAWVNFTVFDYACNLQQGVFDLYMWPVHEPLVDTVNYMGTTVSNSATHDAISLRIEVPRPAGGVNVSRPNMPIMFPSEERVKSDGEYSRINRPDSKGFQNRKVFELEEIVKRDPLAQLEEQDKELVWTMREYCLYELPESLPKVLQSLNWGSRADMTEMYDLLGHWQALQPEKALELLDYHYPDIAVRNWAVQSLDNMDDFTLSKYLLQLVQVLKFELYLDTALGHFLLRRALKNKRIGHFLFWHLRAEMHLPEVAVRFGLMLEAYCRGCGAFMKELAKQYDSLEIMKQITQSLQQSGGKAEVLKKIMHDSLQTPHSLEVFSNIRSPLDCSLQLKSLRIEKCKYMDSKMKPLWMVYTNRDSLGKDVLEIFKNGDDLRQDMLTLQIIGIMDGFWQQAGLDLKMTPYGCLSTGKKTGVIEVVLNSATLAKIQKEKGGGAKGAFKNHTLLAYLKEHNPDRESLESAVQVFTKSCAGYCVATYVLGIGDRHSDNIMLTKSGNLLHIDFGHFLGNFKSKLGVKRERVPFVLTNDFIYTIVKGDRMMEKHSHFDDFKKLCEKAFLLLRKHGDLFINLFAMMLSTGIPELRTAEDVNYVREALCLGKSDKVALKDFQAKFMYAVEKNHFVSANWWVHNLAKSQN